MFELLGAIPVIGSIVTSLTTAFFNAKVNMYVARTGATRDTAVAAIQAAAIADHERSAQMGVVAASKVLTWLVVAFAIPIVAYETKVIVYDTMLGLGNTLPIKGEVGEWMNTIINWLFGASTTLAVSQAAFRQLGK